MVSLANRQGQELEMCCKCDEPTGRAGISDDSLYLDIGDGPYCEECFEPRPPCFVVHSLDDWGPVRATSITEGNITWDNLPTYEIPAMVAKGRMLVIGPTHSDIRLDQPIHYHQRPNLRERYPEVNDDNPE